MSVEGSRRSGERKELRGKGLGVWGGREIGVLRKAWRLGVRGRRSLAGITGRERSGARRHLLRSGRIRGADR